MINIDTIYQRVLTAANKEQRGYITPQEFNLFANQSQMDIFEQYFYDKNQFDRAPENATEFSNMTNILDEKISIFKKVTSLSALGTVGEFEIPKSTYRLGSVIYNSKYPVSEIEHEELMNIQLSKLSAPTSTQSVYIRKENNSNQQVIQIYPNSINSNISITETRKPATVRWGYVVLDGKALYDASSSQNFELHASEEKKLVLKILALAGILLKDGNLYQVASSEEQIATQQQKS